MKCIIYLVLFIQVFCLNTILAQSDEVGEIDPYDAMRTIYYEVDFIKKYGHTKAHHVISAIEALNENGFNFEIEKPSANRGYVENESKSSQLESLDYYDEQYKIWIQFLSGDSDIIENSWKTIRHIGEYSGFQLGNEGNIYVKKDSTQNSFLNTLFTGSNYIVSIGSKLPYIYKGGMESLNKENKEYLLEKIDKSYTVVSSLSQFSVASKDFMYKWSEEPLTASERLYGFNQFWTEVKYNFAFFDQVPELDWDHVYLNYVDIFLADQSNEKYFRNMQKLCALLQDGHTNVYPPWQYQTSTPPIRLKHIDKKAIVVNIDETYAKSLPKGTEIIAIDNIPTTTYMETKIFPYISSSTKHILYNNGVRDLLEGPSEQDVTLLAKLPDGTETTTTLPRDQQSNEVNWHYEWPKRRGLIEFSVHDNGVAYLALNSFSDAQIIQEFEALIDTLQYSKKFILDLRFNGGGNSGVGYAILKYFADQPFRSSRWQTREHKASYKAWGSFYKDEDAASLDDWALESVKTWQGDYWHIGELDTIRPDKKIYFHDKIIVLIGNNTASAAEDFLVALDDLDIAILMGEPTYGSTGQPLQLALPRGGSARICTKKDTYPDGREFVGFGIEPDVFVAPNVDNFIQGRDVVLERAFQWLESKK